MTHFFRGALWEIAIHGKTAVDGLSFCLEYSLFGALFATAGFAEAKLVHKLKSYAKFIDTSLALNLCLDVSILSLISYSILTDQEDHYLLRLTAPEARTLLVVMAADCHDLGLWLGNLERPDELGSWLHHLGSVVGLGYVLGRGVGGGAIVRLLLDIGTALLDRLDEALPRLVGRSFLRRPVLGRPLGYWLPAAHWTAWLVLRSLYYPYICSLTLWELYESGREPGFACLFAPWTLFALVDGWSPVFFRRKEIKEAFGNFIWPTRRPS